MLFNSFEFLLFFPLVTTLYFLLPHRFRWMHLLAASCVFYMAFIPVYILILLLLIVIDYLAGRMIENAGGIHRKSFLVVSIVANIGVLGFFKYYNFFVDNVQGFLPHVGVTTQNLPFLEIILPVGLSFHTFQAMSYTIEVYRGKQPAEKHFGIYALYVMFYPQLAAGPIERPQHMLHQLREKHFFNPDNITKGLKLMLWGFFMKLVVADRLGLYINAIYNHPGEHNGNTLLLATFFFSFQLYGDFAGYSLIAIGSAKTMGFDLMTNFNRPFWSGSITEFWTRWHISLTTWFRDYLFIPLGGSRKGIPRLYLNILIVYLLSGLWHGANWTFIVWGILNGFFIVFGVMLNRAFPFLIKIKTGWRHRIIGFARFSIMVFLFMIARVFFRARSVDESLGIIKKILTNRGQIFIPHGRSELIFCGIALLILFLVELQQEHFAGKFAGLNNTNTTVRYATYCALAVGILLLGVFDGGQFIYFQF